MYLLDLTAAFLAGYGVCNVVTTMIMNRDHQRTMEEINAAERKNRFLQAQWADAVRENQVVREEARRKGVQF